VLTAAEECALAQAMRRSRESLRAALAQVPGVAQRLVCLWRERAANDRVPERLSERYEQGTPPPAELRALASELAELAPLALRRTATAARSRAREAAAERFERFDPRTPLLIEWTTALERDLAESCQAGGRWGMARTELAAWSREACHQRDAYLAARATFARHNLRLVVHIAKDFQGNGAPLADLVQDGNVALLRAVEKFDDRRGFRFSTYGGWWIVQALQRCTQREAHLVALPGDVIDDQRRLRHHDARMRCALGRPPSDTELACAAELSPARLGRALGSRLRPRSLDAPLGAEEQRSLGDVLPDPGAADPAERLDEASRAACVERLLAEAPPRERYVLRARFGLGGAEERTLQDLANELGLSRERIRQIENHALARLEHSATELGLSPCN
jgi:RNA polymerase primary sigma factor